ncbi:hypothetical protein NDU88_008948 [Pleurodeles waltl]|uniref:Uncharacterized protein n=1 Tax=Pleurodeles waltl TaxID=8319 RepID=A0AAV7QRI4_PLEWA|nr:hypothetical protein NDU88_008948 [Pleurodeles waltl]
MLRPAPAGLRASEAPRQQGPWASLRCGAYERQGAACGDCRWSLPLLPPQDLSVIGESTVGPPGPVHWWLLDGAAW